MVLFSQKYRKYFIALTLGGSCVIVTLLLAALIVIRNTSMLRTELQKFITTQIGAPVTFSDVPLSLLGFEVKNLKVQHPASLALGVKKPPFLSLKQALVAINPWQLLRGQLRVDSILFDGIEIIDQCRGQMCSSTTFMRELSSRGTVSPEPPPSERGQAFSFAVIPFGLSVSVEKLQIQDFSFKQIEIKANGEGIVKKSVSRLNFSLGARLDASHANMQAKLAVEDVIINSQAIGSFDLSNQITAKINGDQLESVQFVANSSQGIAVRVEGATKASKGQLQIKELEGGLHVKAKHFCGLASLFVKEFSCDGELNLLLSSTTEGVTHRFQGEDLMFRMKPPPFEGISEVFVKKLQLDYTGLISPDLLSLNSGEASLAAPHILVGLSSGKQVGFPLTLATQLKGLKSSYFDRVGLEFSAGTLLKGEFDARSPNSNSIDVKANLNTPSFQEVRGVALALREMVPAVSLLPQKIEGSSSVSFKANLPFDIQGLIQSSPRQIFANSRLSVFSKTELTNLEDVRSGLSIEGAMMSLALHKEGKQLNSRLDITAGNIGLRSPQALDERPNLEVQKYSTTLIADSTISSGDGPPLENLKLSLAANTSGVKVRELSEIPPEFLATKLELEALFDGSSQLDLSSLKLQLPNAGVNAALTSKLTLGPDHLPELGQITLSASSKTEHLSGKSRAELSGLAALDLQAQLKEGELDLNSNIRFDQFNLLIPASDEREIALQITSLNGTIPFSQKISLKGLMPASKKTSMAWMTVDQMRGPSPPKDREPGDAAQEAEAKMAQNLDNYLGQNISPVQLGDRMVNLDYSGFAGFYPKRSTLEAERIRVAGIDLTNIEVDLEILQNLLAINNISMAALDGDIQGKFHLIFLPRPSFAETSFHVTGINTQRLLDRFPRMKSKAESWLLGKNPSIDGTFQFKQNFTQNSSGGNFELTKIGLEQLRMILFYLDPEQKDLTIQTIADVLNYSSLVAGVERVSMPIKNGELDVDIRLKFLGAPLPLPKIRRFPVHQIIANAAH
jgi:hypothetical protein